MAASDAWSLIIGLHLSLTERGSELPGRVRRLARSPIAPSDLLADYGSPLSPQRHTRLGI